MTTSPYRILFSCVFIIALVTGLVACDSDDDDDSDSNSPNAATMQATIDGVNYEESVFAVFSSSSGGDITNVNAGTENDAAPNLSIAVGISPGTTGSYDVATEMAQITMETDTADFLAAVPGDVGTVTISDYSDGTISGTFEGTLISQNDTTQSVNVTDGQFDDIPVK